MEGAADVAPTRGSRKSCLGCRRMYATERANDGKVELSSEIFGLVEPSLQAPQRMERYGYDTVGADQYLGARRGDEPSERASEPTPPAVLEGLQDPAQRAVVLTSRARRAERMRPAPAAGAAVEGGADDAPRGQRIATGPAERRRQRAHEAPAGVTDGPVERRVEHGGACRTTGSEGDREERVYAGSANSCRSTLPQSRSRS